MSNHSEQRTILFHHLELIMYSSVLSVNGKRSLLTGIIFHMKYMPF